MVFEAAVDEWCRAAGFDVLLVPPLYHLAEDDPCWRELDGAAVVLSWLYPRPMDWLLKRHGFELPAISMRDCAEPADVLEAIQSYVEPRPTGTVREMTAEYSERWYPVIDQSRCVNCHHCLQFCLFGVYTLDDEGAVCATNPDSCKPGCPACSRICPKGAIIFPLYERDPAIAGAPGLFMTPDLAARKMFYTRTKKPCPRCGLAETVPGSLDAALCQECGRPLPTTAEDRPDLDEIDALIDDLDRLAKGRG